MTLSADWRPLDIPGDSSKPFTDYSRWRLDANDGGRHIWSYISEEVAQATPQPLVDKYWTGNPLNLPALPPAKDALEAARKGFTFLRHLQVDGGHWPGLYDGPMFVLPGLVIGSYVAGMAFKREERLEMARYLMQKAHPVDGGWGLHTEGVSTCFGTALNYVALRLLGVHADNPTCIKARACLHNLGGATCVPSWGKFWLSILNVYEWEGNNPIPPELFILPDWLPIHPHKWWVHTRQIYIPMSYLYGIRWKAPEDEFILSLRQELYTQDYYTINWPAQRNNVCPIDIFAEHHPILNVANVVLGVYEGCPIPPLRRVALARVYDLVVKEDENTAYQDLGPINKMMNLIIRTIVDGPESDAYAQHKLKRRDFMWVSPIGMMMSGTNGCQLWDIVFIVHAVVESGIANDPENRESMLKALHWLDETQIRDNPKHYQSAYRHTSKGAWPFSTKEQSYAVSDCTAEALKAVIFLQEHLDYTPKLISKERLCDSVDLLIGMQNSDGGFASYEAIRASHWLEVLNPAEVFGNVMTEFNYPECTTSTITGLAFFRKHFPDYRSADIERTIQRAIKYLHSAQRSNGLWYGSWGICFTYATMFALESLSLVGETYASSARVRRACDVLVSKQRDDGGWGESYLACAEERWVDHEKTQVVNTSWATLALMYAQYPYPGPIGRAVKMVMGRQLPDGSWAQEAMEGMFNKTCTIAYPLFKFSFTVWMLGKAQKYLARLRETPQVANEKLSTNGKANGY